LRYDFTRQSSIFVVMKKNKIKISNDKKKIFIAEIKDFFLKEFEQELGDLRADIVLDFMLEKIGPDIYNTAVNDSRKWFRERFEDLDADFFLLEK